MRTIRDLVSGSVMSFIGVLTVFVVVISIFLGFQPAVQASIDVEEVYHRCGSGDSAGTDDQIIMDTVTEDLIKHTAQYSFNHYDEIELGFLNVYGHAWCRTPMSFEDCTTCLHVANVKRFGDCGFVKGIQVMLKDCFMRLEEYDFKYDTITVR